MKNNDPIFWPDDEYDLTLNQQRKRNFEQSLNILQTMWYQADLDQRFFLGDQDIWGSIFPGANNFRRKMFNFNLIHPEIQVITGMQRRYRKSTACIPMKSGSQKTSDQITKTLYHVHNRSKYYATVSEAFEQGALVQGLGFISHYISYLDDPISGDICHRYVDMKSTLFDPYFRKNDMSDCRFFCTRQFFSKEEAALIYYDFYDKIMSLPKGVYRDDKFYYMPEVYQIQTPDVVAVDEYWYLSQREATYLVDVETEETQEFSGEKEDLKKILKMFKGRLVSVKKRKPTVRRSIIINDRTLVDESNPYGIDRYPYVPVVAYNTNTEYYAYKFKSVVRDLRDPQYLFNRLKVSDLDTIESQQQGIKAKKGALVTPDDVFNAGNGRFLCIDPKFSMDDVQQMDIHPPAPARLEMENMLQGIMHSISGVNEALAGTNVDDKAGIISALRSSAGITTLTRLFDQLDDAQILGGQIDIEMIQKNYTFGKIKQIINEDPTEEFDSKLFREYGCKVVQASLTESQQQLNLQQLLYLREITGIPIPSKIILQATTIQNKDELIESIVKEEQAAAQIKQQTDQLALQQMQVENSTKLGYAQSQMSLAKEREARIVYDMAVAEDKLKRAHEQDTAALLNITKGIKELQDMDISQLQKKLAIIREIDLHSQQMQQDLVVQNVPNFSTQQVEVPNQTNANIGARL